MEEKSTFSLFSTGWRLIPGDKKNPDSFKVRRAKVGGYKDYFTDEQVGEIDAMVDADLLPQIGYTRGENATPGETSLPAGSRSPLTEH
jgi:hypothetical protein